MSTAAVDLEALRREALRLNARFVQEIVEAHNFCPYAKGAWAEGSVDREVFVDCDFAHEPVLNFIDRLEARAQTEIGLAIFPRITTDQRGWERLVAGLREADSNRRPRGQRPAFVSATFHPDYAYDARTSDTLVWFLRRTPDPTIQFVRYASLQELRGNQPEKIVVDPKNIDWKALAEASKKSLSDKIADYNHATVTRLGKESVEAVYESIHTDRRETYLALGVLQPGS